MIIDNDNHEYRIGDKLINWLLGLPVEFAGLNSTVFFFTEPQTCYRTLMGVCHEPLSQDELKFGIDQRFPLK